MYCKHTHSKNTSCAIRIHTVKTRHRHSCGKNASCAAGIHAVKNTLQLKNAALATFCGNCTSIKDPIHFLKSVMRSNQSLRETSGADI